MVIDTARVAAAEVDTAIVEPEAPTPVRAAEPRTHRVANGETLDGIARRYGVDVDAISAANGGLDPRRLQERDPHL